MKRGVTLIELIVALSLSVLLVATTGGVIKAMAQKKKVFADQLNVQPWRLELAERLRSDLCQSQEMRIGGRTLELSGFCGHGESGEPAQIPVTVMWRLKEKDGRRYLFRTERMRGGIEELTARPRTELVAVGIANVSVGTFAGLEYEDKIEMQTLTSAERNISPAGDWTAIPPILKLTVLAGNNEVLIDELIYR